MASSGSDMLRFLSVRHLAVIDRLEVEFGPGLNVLTGETGAGKSMLVEAIDLLVGGRASADLVRTGEDTGHHSGHLRNGRTAAKSSSDAKSPRRAAAARSSMTRSPRPRRCATSARGS